MPDQTPPIVTSQLMTATTLWQPDRAEQVPSWPVPTMPVALWRGVQCLCPACGKTKSFAGYLKVVPECLNCGAPLGNIRADDAPPYFTIFIVGHILAPILFWAETGFHPELWVLAAIFLPLSLVMTLGLLRPVKGATLGLMLKLGMIKTEDA